MLLEIENLHIAERRDDNNYSAESSDGNHRKVEIDDKHKSEEIVDGKLLVPKHLEKQSHANSREQVATSCKASNNVFWNLGRKSRDGFSTDIDSKE